jgi:hypothetical protein
VSGTRFFTCQRCGQGGEDIDTLVDSGHAWCTTCERPALLLVTADTPRRI